MDTLNNEVLIAVYRVREYGQGYSITMPPEWIKECNIEPGTKVNLYRLAGTNELILRPEPEQPPLKKVNG